MALCSSVFFFGLGFQGFDATVWFDEALRESSRPSPAINGCIALLRMADDPLQGGDLESCVVEEGAATPLHSSLTICSSMFSFPGLDSSSVNDYGECFREALWDEEKPLSLQFQRRQSYCLMTSIWGRVRPCG